MRLPVLAAAVPLLWLGLEDEAASIGGRMRIVERNDVVRHGTEVDVLETPILPALELPLARIFRD